jgi:Lon protease-like protein
VDDDFNTPDGRLVARLFPLPGMVLFPNVALRLHVFEPRYRQLTEHALADDQLITMVQIHPDADITVLKPKIETHACIGEILEHNRLADGRFNLLLLGKKRVRLIREIACNTLFRQAEAEILEDIVLDPEDTTHATELVERFRNLAAEHGTLDENLSELLSANVSLGVLTDMLTNALGLPPQIKQTFLSETIVERRAEKLIDLLKQVELSTHTTRHPPYPPRISLN